MSVPTARGEGCGIQAKPAGAVPGTVCFQAGSEGHADGGAGRAGEGRLDLTLTGWTRPGYYTGALPSLFVNLAATTRERGFLTL